MLDDAEKFAAESRENEEEAKKMAAVDTYVAQSFTKSAQMSKQMAMIWKNKAQLMTHNATLTTHFNKIDIYNEALLNNETVDEAQTYNAIAQLLQSCAQISDEMAQICDAIGQTHEESAKVNDELSQLCETEAKSNSESSEKLKAKAKSNHQLSEMICDAVNQECYTMCYDALSSSSSLIKFNSQVNVAEASEYRKEASIHKDNASQYRQEVALYRLMQLTYSR